MSLLHINTSLCSTSTPVIVHNTTAAAREVTAYNCLPIETPLIELAALFERSLGDGSDVVQKEMFQLTSLGGERLATRPEGTASVIRALRQREGQPHGRVWYHGPMFRYERPQSGRYRQVNCACLSPHRLTLHALRSSISSGSSLLGATA
jgi:histidyl-tRNA synthetase